MDDKENLPQYGKEKSHSALTLWLTVGDGLEQWPASHLRYCGFDSRRLQLKYYAAFAASSKTERIHSALDFPFSLLARVIAL
jgi:hypothetical protein